MDMTAIELGPNEPLMVIQGVAYPIRWVINRHLCKVFSPSDDVAARAEKAFNLQRAALVRAKKQGLSLWFLGEGIPERCGQPEPRTGKTGRVIHLATELKSAKPTTRGSGYSSRFSDGESPGWHNVVRAYESALDEI